MSRKRLWRIEGDVLTCVPPTREDVAYHEAGHALAAVLWVGNVHDVTIRPTGENRGHVRTRSLGTANPDYWRAMLARPDLTDDARSLTVRKVYGLIRYDLAGYAAESLHRGASVLPSWRVTDDPDHVSAADYVRVLYPEASSFLTTTLLQRQYEKVSRFLRRHTQHLDAVAKALVRHETLNERAFYSVLDRLPWMQYRGQPEIVDAHVGRAAA